jgi:hypothetical protein
MYDLPPWLERFKTEAITEKQMFAIRITCSRLGLTFNGRTKYDAWRFLDEHYRKTPPKDLGLAKKPKLMDNERALFRYGRKFDDDLPTLEL